MIAKKLNKPLILSVLLIIVIFNCGSIFMYHYINNGNTSVIKNNSICTVYTPHREYRRINRSLLSTTNGMLKFSLADNTVVVTRAFTIECFEEML